jgi:hypothetical protein
MSPKPDCKPSHCSSRDVPQRVQRAAKRTAMKKTQQTSEVQGTATAPATTANRVSSIGACSIAVAEGVANPHGVPFEAPSAGNGSGGAEDGQSSAPAQVVDTKAPSERLSPPLSAPSPFPSSGSVDGEQTDSERRGLEDMPLGRQCKKCGRTVFVDGAHCPKPCGGWLLENDGAVRGGRYSTVALRKEREAILERWRAKYRGADGKVHAAVDSVLRQLAKLEAVSDRCVRWSESTKDPVTSIKHNAVIQTIERCADRTARLHVVLQAIAPTTEYQGPRTVTFGGRFRANGEYIPPFQIANDETPTVVDHQEPVIEAETLAPPAATSPAQPSPLASERPASTRPSTPPPVAAEPVAEAPAPAPSTFGTPVKRTNLDRLGVGPDDAGWFNSHSGSVPIGRPRFRW